MKALRSIAAGLMLSGLSGLTLAAGNPLSVHVLNLENGLPSPDVRVTLEQRQGDTWKSLNSGETNAQGRITALYPEGKALEKGTYRVTFKTGDWFATQKASTFFPKFR